MIPALLGHLLLPKKRQGEEHDQTSRHPWLCQSSLSLWIPKTWLQDGEERGPRAASPEGLSESGWQGCDRAMETAPMNGPG